ncbi:MAG: UTP--glucose-1-phosphate uridylyltransferase GalU [Candidatus Firestonebacteria bacterium]
MKIKKAVVPAAGLGTRFLPATKAQPKEMLPIFDKPAIQYIVEEAISAGIEDILIVTGRGKQTIENHFDKSFELEHYLREKRQYQLLKSIEEIGSLINVHYVRQKEPLGLGHAILCAKSFVNNEPFAVFLADDLIYAPRKSAIAQLIDVYNSYKTSVLAVETVPKEKMSSYGIINPILIKDRLYQVKDIVEKPKQENAPSDLGVVGRYILVPEIMDILEKTPRGVNGEIQLTDALKIFLKRHKFYAVKFEGKRYDVGTKLGYVEATVEYALRQKEISAKLIEYFKKLVEGL